MIEPLREFARAVEARWLAAIVALGFALRLGWVLSVHSGLVQNVDMSWYFVTAKNLAEGYGMTARIVQPVGEVAGPGGTQATLWPPGYSLTLGVVFKLFGASLTAGKMLNVVYGTLMIPLVFLLARRLFKGTVALVATALFAVYPANIFWSSVLFSDTVFTLPFLTATVLLVYAGPRPTRLQALGFGLALGYAEIIRPPAIVVLGAAATYWLIRAESKRTVLKPVAIALAGICLWVVPVAIWNSVRTDKLKLVSENVGYNLRIGHAPYSTGRYTTPSDLWAASDPNTGALPSDSLAIRRSVDYAVHHPVDEARLSVKKVFYLYTTDSDAIIWASTENRTPIWGSFSTSEHMMDLADVATYVALLLAIAAVPLTFSLRDERLLLWLLLAFWTAAHIVFFGEPRYHLPVLPIILTMSAVGIVEGWRALASMLTAKHRRAGVRSGGDTPDRRKAAAPPGSSLWSGSRSGDIRSGDQPRC
ncbi:MAG: glycosyltransferase family 39 protein [Chloroflexota bacterium]|nr:glycosyltransferase family 39 protein [Chloroflexota bacterium]